MAHLREAFRHALRRHAIHPPKHALGIAVDHGKRRSKFMGDHRDELALETVELALLVEGDLKLLGIGFEDLKSARHLADLVPSLGRGMAIVRSPAAIVSMVSVISRMGRTRPDTAMPIVSATTIVITQNCLKCDQTIACCASASC